MKVTGLLFLVRLMGQARLRAWMLHQDCTRVIPRCLVGVLHPRRE